MKLFRLISFYFTSEQFAVGGNPLFFDSQQGVGQMTSSLRTYI